MTDDVEYIAFCPACKTMETLWFYKGTLVKTQKFNQRNGKIYHNCGAAKPCNLYFHNVRMEKWMEN